MELGLGGRKSGFVRRAHARDGGHDGGDALQARKQLPMRNGSKVDAPTSRVAATSKNRWCLLSQYAGPAAWGWVVQHVWRKGGGRAGVAGCGRWQHRARKDEIHRGVFQYCQKTSSAVATVSLSCNFVWRRPSAAGRVSRGMLGSIIHDED